MLKIKFKEQLKYSRSLDNLLGFICSFLKVGNNEVNYELQVNALCLSLFLSPLFSMFVSRVFFVVFFKLNLNLMLKSISLTNSVKSIF